MDAVALRQIIVVRRSSFALEFVDVDVVNKAWHSAKRHEQQEGDHRNGIHQSETFNDPMPNKKKGHAEYPESKPKHD
jgi:hypothetical protein